ncbi:MAG TPA: MvaI/BcnI family restriction endonuclease [Candidatus Binataceae bacterium]|nr:MvaI/BcnI family restriction endonuclease [Candidatus Binataceae bacterium]
MGWIPTARAGNAGGIGNTLEDFIGIKENNLPIPNAAEWEMKTHRIGSVSLMTLFHVEPSPRALKFVPLVLLPKYGWPHREAGERHPLGELSFRQTINAASPSDRGFKVVLDHSTSKVLISFSAKAVDSRHEQWLNTVETRAGLDELGPQPYWGFDDLMHKAGSKLANCFYVGAETKRVAGKEFFHYSEILMMQEFGLEGLLKGLEEGWVFIDFDARSGHNHGTKFRIRQDRFPSLYRQVSKW